MILVDDTIAKDLILSCCTEENNSVDDECQMNRNVKQMDIYERAK